MSTTAVKVFAQLEIDIAKMFTDPDAQEEAVDNKDADIIRVDFGKGLTKLLTSLTIVA